MKRIVALLFALADVAERAAIRSYPVRCLVLWVLRRAELVAQNWVADDMQPAPSGCENPMVAVLRRNSHAEAMHLAQAFRALARTLRRQVRLDERLARRLQRGGANRATAGATQQGLPESGSFRQLARDLHAAIYDLGGFAFLAAPRLDTS